MSRKRALGSVGPWALAVAIAVPGCLAAGEEPKVRVVAKPRVQVHTPSPGEHFEHRVVVEAGEEPEIMVWSSDGDFEGGGHPKIMLLGRGFIGVQLTELTPELRTYFGVGDSGVMVGSVESDGPAAKSGLKVGDIVTAVDGESVESSSDVARLVRRKKEGDVATLEVWRDGRVENLTVNVAERERRSLDVGPIFWKEGNFAAMPELQEKIRDGLAPALGRLESLLDDPELKDRMIRLRTRNQELEEKLEAVERRLQDLEKRLNDGSR